MANPFHFVSGITMICSRARFLHEQTTISPPQPQVAESTGNNNSSTRGSDNSRDSVGVEQEQVSSSAEEFGEEDTSEEDRVGSESSTSSTSSIAPANKQTITDE